MSWIYLFAAIVLETIGTALLKTANGFTILLPSIGAVLAYIFCFYFLSLAFKTIDISIAYAVWGALGIVLVALIGFFYFHETLSPLKILFIVMIIIATLGLRLVK